MRFPKRVSESQRSVLHRPDGCATMGVVGDGERFWQALDELVARCGPVVDRPAGSAHPRHADFRYPLDYGYLQDTRGGDGAGADVWLGSLGERRVTGVVCTVDLDKRDVEVKILIGCTPAEAWTILAVHNWGGQSGWLVERPSGGQAEASEFAAPPCAGAGISQDP